MLDLRLFRPKIAGAHGEQSKQPRVPGAAIILILLCATGLHAAPNDWSAWRFAHTVSIRAQGGSGSSTQARFDANGYLLIDNMVGPPQGGASSSLGRFDTAGNLLVNCALGCSGGGGTPGGNDTDVQFNNMGMFAGSDNFSWDYTNQALNVTGVGSFFHATTGDDATLQGTNATFPGDSNNYDFFYGVVGGALVNGTGTIPIIAGEVGQIDSEPGGGGSIGQAAEFYATTPGLNGSTTFGEMTGWLITDQNPGNTGLITQSNGIHIEAQTAPGGYLRMDAPMGGTGSVVVNPQSAAGTPTLLWPTTSGTLASSATTPIALNATTGVISCSTCNTSSATVSSIATTAPITGGTITTIGTIACATCVTSAAALTSNALILGGGLQASSALGSLGTTTTVLHGNATGAPTFGSVVSADLNITTSSCTNQFLTAISATGTGTCTTDVLASAQHANQGTTTTVLHGNAAGNPAFGAVALATDVSGQLPIGAVGSAGLTGTSPIAISAGGAISCTTCNTTSANVNSVTGDGTIITNSASTGAVTLTIAGTSGGVPCFSSTSAWKSSVLLTSNVVPKGGGAGNCPTNSSVTDNGTSVTSTDASGYIAPEIATNQATAGAYGLSQGSTTAAAFPCNVANTICHQAPTAVTSYQVTEPGGGPANNAMMKTYTALSSASTTESFSQAPQKAMLTTAYTNSTTSNTNITGLSFAVDASASYTIHCHGLYKAAATGGLVLTVTGPASPTLVTYDLLQVITLTASAPTFREDVGTGSAYPSAVGNAIVTTITDQGFDFTMGFTNGVTAGTWQLQAKSSAAVALTVEAGSFCTAQ